MFLYRVIQALDSHRVPYAVAGGFAVALHGAVRGTIDVDLVIRLKREDYVKTEQALTEMGLTPRLPVTAADVFAFREEYIRNRNLIAWSYVNPRDPSEIVDIIITHDLARMKTKTLKHQGKSIRVLSLESLIQMKNESNRPQDREDIKALKRIRGTP